MLCSGRESGGVVPVTSALRTSGAGEAGGLLLWLSLVSQGSDPQDYHLLKPALVNDP